jgi:leucyl aminopeptidase
MSEPKPWLPETAAQMGIGDAPSLATREIRTVAASMWERVAADLDPSTRDWLAAQNFDGKPGASAYAPDADGRPGAIWLGLDESDVGSAFASLAGRAPEGQYRVASEGAPSMNVGEAARGWALGTYRFNLSSEMVLAKTVLHLKSSPSVEASVRRAAAIRLSRNLVNCPTNELGPERLAKTARAVATHFGAETTEIIGDALLAEGFPAIHAVGRAASEAPRLIDIRWGKPGKPAVTLIGKGVCFDTGGLNVKSMAGMRHMKRDMGGAAVILGLGALVMSEDMPVSLRILLPIVENSIAGNAMRPGDLIATRDGATIEVENTDCEGRVILADALTYAMEENPEVVIDCATLTGSARTAFGGEIQALFASNDTLGRALQEAGARTGDAVWQMPIWQGYRAKVSAPTGDLLNMAPGGYAGAITAALFLQHFAAAASDWAHLDISAWNDSPRPGRPVGGEATGLSAIFDYLNGRYGGR